MSDALDCSDLVSFDELEPREHQRLLAVRTLLGGTDRLGHRFLSKGDPMKLLDRRHSAAAIVLLGAATGLPRPWSSCFGSGTFGSP